MPTRLATSTFSSTTPGILEFGSILDTPLDIVAREFDTNFYGQLNMARAFAPVIERNGGGAIVNVLTVVALASMPGLAAYNASNPNPWSMTQFRFAAVSPPRKSPS